MRITPDQLTKSLESQGVRPETLKARMKAEMVWTSLVRGRFKESLQVGEKDVADARQAKAAIRAQVEGFEYKMQPIVLIVPRGSPPRDDRSAEKGSRALRERVQSCEEANSLVPVDAERHDPRHRHQDLRRPAGPAAQSARQDRRSAI